MQKQTIDKLKKAAPLALGSSMLVLSMMPAAAAFAANNYITNVTTTANGTSVKATSNTNPKGLHVWYQFRATTPQGHTWILRKFEAGNTFTWTPPQAGNYTVQAFALTQYQVGTKQWNKAIAGTTTTDTSVTKLAISTSVSGELAPNALDILTVTATDAAGNTVTDLSSVTWSISPTSGATLSALQSGGEVFDATTPGTYTVTASVGGMTATKTIDVYGSLAGVKLSAASASVVADGTASDTITVSAVDSSGNVIPDFNGTVSVTTTAGTLNTGTVTLTSGTGTFSISNGATGTDTISASDLVNSNGTQNPLTLTYGSATVTAVTPTEAALSVSAANPAVSENAPTSDTVTVTLLDQAGNPLPPADAYLGAKDITVTLTGPGSLGATAATLSGATTSQTAYVWPGYSAPISVWSIQAEPGPITVSASGAGLTPSETTINAVTVGQPAKIAVSSTTGSLSTGTTIGGDPLPAGTTFTQYTVTVEDINGNAVGAPSGGDTLTISDVTNGGTLAFYNDNSGQPNGALGTSGSDYIATIAAGSTQKTIDVFNTTSQSGTATITIQSANPSATVTVPYTFVIGAPSTVDLTGASDILLNGTATYTAQVTDAAGNDTADGAGPVTFTLTSAPSGTTFANGSLTYTTTLNASGAATVAVDAGATSGSYTISAHVGTLDLGTVTGSVVQATSYVSQIGVYSGGVTTPTATSVVANGSSATLTGMAAATYTAIEENAVQQPVSATDRVTVTSSNPSVVLVGASASTPAPGGAYTASFSSDSGYFSLIGGEAGTATITVADASNPAVKPVSFTVTVGAPIAAAIFGPAAAAANESGAANASSTDVAFFDLNGTATEAHYASNWADFGTYSNGIFTVTPPTLYTAVPVPSGTSATTLAASGDTLAVWPGSTSGTYYYVDLSQETPGAGSTLGHAYVGLNVMGPTGANISLAVNGGSYDGNTATVDYAYFTVATESTVGSWSVANPQSMALSAQATYNNGVTVTYPITVQEP